MTKQELIHVLTEKSEDLTVNDARTVVGIILDSMADGLAEGKRVEIRGFGSMSLRYRAPRRGRNPKTGAIVHVPGKYFPHFKPGRELRERVDTLSD